MLHSPLCLRLRGELMIAIVWICLGSAAVATATASTASVTVSGWSNPYLAGMPNGSGCCSGDSAPAQSPAFVSFPLSAGSAIAFFATGSVNFAGAPPSPDPPDGSYFFGGTPSNNGISSINAPVNALVGVFLDDSQPNLSIAPFSLDFSSGGLGTSFTNLSPLLKQVFFIGDGLTGNGTGSVQNFIVPSGATRLFLGTVDGYGWYDNWGAFNVQVSDVAQVSNAPEPGLFWFVGVALIGILFYARNAGFAITRRGTSEADGGIK